MFSTFQFSASPMDGKEECETDGKSKQTGSCDDIKTNHHQSRHQAPNPANFKSTLLSEIMSLRGVCNCSGHCGNSIMKFSLLVYRAMLDQISNQIKSSHRRGEMCNYRLLCKYILNGLTKLKYNDKASSLDNLSSIYSGINKDVIVSS